MGMKSKGAKGDPIVFIQWWEKLHKCLLQLCELFLCHGSWEGQYRIQWGWKISGHNPTFHRLLTQRRNWGADFKFRGLSNFMVGAIEWTERILKHFEHSLRSTSIYSVVGVSCYPYHFDRDIWRAFCELWGPSTNTSHVGTREVGISLYDLKGIGGLPFVGDIYEEFPS